MTYTVAADRSGMSCTVTSTDASHGFQLVTTYITDPASDTVLMHTTLRDLPGSGTNLARLRPYARLDAHVNGNGGGRSQNGRPHTQSLAAAGGSLSRPFGQVEHEYLRGWAAYDASLRPPPDRFPGLRDSQAAGLRGHYYPSANVLKASEDKTYPGAIVASLASPWGQSVPAGVTSGGEPSYFGSYREVFARDLYEAFTGLLADGDIATARAATLFLFERQQLADGSMPRNSLLNGKPAPDTGGIQLDQPASPILLAYHARPPPDPPP